MNGPMRRGTPATLSGRPLLALFCAVTIAFNLFALGHTRGVVATRHVEAAITAVATGQPCPPTTHGRTICPFATFIPSTLPDADVPRLPGEARIQHFARANHIAPASHINDAPFRPPRGI